MKTLLVLFIYSISFLSTSCQDNDNLSDSELLSIVENGDIIFQVLESSQSKAIQLATGSDYSHVGIIYIEDGQAFVYEAVGPVRLIPLRQFINQGKNSHYVIKRLQNRELRANEIENMKEVGFRYKGKAYDFVFEWTDDKIYCSELVWKIYKQGCGIEVGEMQKLKDFDLSHPAVQEKLKERYGDNVPYEEKVISPGAMFDSELLETVISSGSQ